MAPYFINWSEYRSAFEREATRILGQKVTVAGDAKARLLPFPSVTFEDVRVGEAERPLVVADRFSMDAELAPFLSGEVLIFDMRLVNPKVTLDLDERGLPEWPLPETGPVSPAQVTLETASIVNATVVLRDRLAERVWQMQGLDATVSAESLFGPYRVTGEGTLNGADLGFRVNTGALAKEGFSLRTVLDLPSAGIELAVDGRVSEPENAGDAPYNGTFTVRPRDVEAVGRYVVEGVFAASPRDVEVPEYRGEFGGVDDPYIVTGTAGISGGTDPRYHIEIKGTQVTIAEEDGAVVAAEGGGAAQTSFSKRLAALQSTLAALPFPPVPGSIDVDLPAVVAGDTTIREIRLAASPDEAGGADARRRWKVSGFTAQLPGRTTVEADGVLQLPLAGDAESRAGFAGDLLVASRQPSGLAMWLTGGVDEPIRRLANAGFAASVDLSPLEQRIEDLEVILGPARMKGSMLRVSDPARRPTLDVALSGEAIDFETLEALGTIFVGGDGAIRFDGHDVDMTINLSDPDIRGVQLERLDASIRSRGTRTEIDRLSVGGLYGASVSATASLERKRDGMHAAVDATVVAGDGAELIRGLSGRFPAAGPLETLRGIAGRNGSAFSDTRLDMVGSFVLHEAATGEASLSASGETGGTALSVTSTAEGNADDPEKARILLNATFDNPVAERIMQQAGLETFAAESAGALGVRASFDGSLFDGMRTRLSVAGDDLNAELAGITTSDILSTGFTGQLQLESRDIEPWMLSLGYGLPGMGLGTIADISAAVSHRGGKTVLRELAAVLNGNRITGDLTVDTDGDAPSLRGDVDFEYLDAGQLYAVITGDAAPVMLAADEDALQREFGAPVLAGHDVEVALTADEVMLPAGGVLTGLSGDFTYREGGMALSGMQAGFGDGTVGGRIDMQNDDGSVIANAQLSAEGIDVAALVPPVEPVIEGRTDLAIQLTGSGRSGAALMSSLNGSGVLSTGPLKVAGLGAGGFQVMTERAEALGYEITPEQMRGIAEEAFLSGEAVLGASDYPLSVTGGTIRIANATARADALSVSADAGVTLPGGEISGQVRLAYEPDTQAVAGPQPAITLSFVSEAEGGFAVTRDFGPVTGYLTQRALETEQARVEALQARLLEKQRLRREVQLYTYRKRTRMRALEETRLRRLEDERTERQQEEARLREEAADRREAAAAAVARRLAEGDDGRAENVPGGTEVQVFRQSQPPQSQPSQQQPPARAQGQSIPQIIELDRLNEFLPEPVIRQDLQPLD